MRCFYFGQQRTRASDEHIPSAFLGSRLKTRSVCAPCNAAAGREIDDPLAAHIMVKAPKALADVRNIRKQGKLPSARYDGIVSSTGEEVSVEFGPAGRRATLADGTEVTEAVEISYGMDFDLWPRFVAKCALGCASKLFPDDWCNEPITGAARALLWGKRPDPSMLPGWETWPQELPEADPVRVALGERRSLVGLIKADDDPDSSVAHAFLFGGQISCRLPLRTVKVEGSGRVWVIDSALTEPPQCEDFDAAIERMLREQGKTTSEIDALRS